MREILGSLHFFGIIDHSGLHEVLASLEACGFGLPFEPFEKFATGQYAAHTHQRTHDLPQPVMDTLFRLGLRAQFTTFPVGMTKSDEERYLLIDPMSGLIFPALMPLGEDYLPYFDLAEEEASPARREVLRRWPSPYDILDNKGLGKLHVVRSRHDALSLARTPEVPVEILSTYRINKKAPLHVQPV